MLARSPLFVVADGMGGAQAGEVASRIAVESFEHGLDERTDAGARARRRSRRRRTPASTSSPRRMPSRRAWARRSPPSTSASEEVAIAHVGDSRAYCLRDGELLRLTDDHSLVDELIRQGRLTPEEAVEHPQRSVITRALGPEGRSRSTPAHSAPARAMCTCSAVTVSRRWSRRPSSPRCCSPIHGLRDAGRGADRGRERGRRAGQHHGPATAPGGGDPLHAATRRTRYADRFPRCRRLRPTGSGRRRREVTGRATPTRR